MENASKALQIAAGVMLGVMIMALMVVSFKRFGEWPEEQDEILTAEQLSAFNKEYQVYDKKMMYGVDVISCLNKVQNNNDKYVLTANDGIRTSSGYFSGNSTKYGLEHMINVYVHIEEPLEERIEIYKINNSGKEVQIFSNLDLHDDITMGHMGFNFPQANGGVSYTLFNEDYNIKTGNWSNKLDSSDYLLTNGGHENYNVNGEDVTYYSLQDNQLYNLLLFSDTYMKQIVKNTSGNYTEWSKAIWYTALYDFKNKRFRCDAMEYSSQTGKVNKIYFSEI